MKSIRPLAVVGSLLALVSVVVVGSNPAYAATNYDVTPVAVGYSDTDNTNWSIVDTFQQAGEVANAPQIWVGPDPSFAHAFRGYVKFSIAPLIGHQIQSVAITAVVDHSYPCSVGVDTALYLYRTSAVVSGGRLTWSNSIPGGVPLGSVNPPSANETSCPHSNVQFTVAGPTLVSDLQTVVNSGVSTYTIALSAASSVTGTGETTVQSRWKRINQSGIQLQVTYA